jgi:hypothetical protein
MCEGANKYALVARRPRRALAGPGRSDDGLEIFPPLLVSVPVRGLGDLLRLLDGRLLNLPAVHIGDVEGGGVRRATAAVRYRGRSGARVVRGWAHRNIRAAGNQQEERQDEAQTVS